MRSNSIAILVILFLISCIGWGAYGGGVEGDGRELWNSFEDTLFDTTATGTSDSLGWFISDTVNLNGVFTDICFYFEIDSPLEGLRAKNVFSDADSFVFNTYLQNSLNRVDWLTVIVDSLLDTGRVQHWIQTVPAPGDVDDTLYGDWWRSILVGHSYAGADTSQACSLRVKQFIKAYNFGGRF